MERHNYRLWDMMEYKPICTCSSNVQHQQLNYICFRSKHNTEQEITLKCWGTTMSWMCHQSPQCHPSSSQHHRGQGFSWTGGKHHQVSPHLLRFSMFALQKTVAASGCILFSKDILMYFGRSGLYALCTLLLAFYGLHHSGYCPYTGPTLKMENNWMATERRNYLCTCTMHLTIRCGVDNVLNDYF